MITLQQDGVEYAYVGVWNVKPGEYFIDTSHEVRHYTNPRPGNLPGLLATIVRPVPIEHTFASVVFVETGELRPVNPGEWFLSAEGPLGVYPAYRGRNCPTGMFYKILKPVRIWTEKDFALVA